MVRHHVKKKKNDSKSSAQRKKEEEKQLEEELQNLDRFAGSSDEEDANGENNNSVDQFSEDEDVPAANGGDGSDSSEQSGSESEDGSAADEDDDYDDVYQEDMKAPHKHKTVNKNEKESDSGDEEDSEDDYADAIDKQSDDYDDDELISSSFTSQSAKGAGMANAMARILGGQSTMQPEKTKKGTKPVILSKTTTPLQRLQQKMKTEEQALRQKRFNRRAENLSAMRLPLAPSAGMSAEKLWKETKKSNRKRNIEDDNDAAAIANEIEGERTHRRIATRGVVALFNAISKHRAAVAAEAAAKEQEKRDAREEGRSARKKGEESGVSSQTKHGFLDLIKKSAKKSAPSSEAQKDESGADGTRKQAPQNGEINKKESAVGWNALKDDYMMNSKLKDWDKMSDDDDDEPSKFDAASFSDGEEELHKSSSRKRLKV